MTPLTISRAAASIGARAATSRATASLLRKSVPHAPATLPLPLPNPQSRTFTSVPPHPTPQQTSRGIWDALKNPRQETIPTNMEKKSAVTIPIPPTQIERMTKKLMEFENNGGDVTMPYDAKERAEKIDMLISGMQTHLRASISADKKSPWHDVQSAVKNLTDKTDEHTPLLIRLPQEAMSDNKYAPLIQMLLPAAIMREFGAQNLADPEDGIRQIGNATSSESKALNLHFIDSITDKKAVMHVSPHTDYGTKSRPDFISISMTQGSDAIGTMIYAPDDVLKTLTDEERDALKENIFYEKKALDKNVRSPILTPDGKSFEKFTYSTRPDQDHLSDTVKSAMIKIRTALASEQNDDRTFFLKTGEIMLFSNRGLHARCGTPDPINFIGEARHGFNIGYAE